MTATITDSQWKTVRATLEETSDRFAEMVSAADPDAKATDDWSVAETAAHVAGIAWMYTTMVVSNDAPLPIPGFKDQVLAASVDDVADLNAVLLRNVPERHPQALAQRLRTEVGHILRVTDGFDPAKPVRWLGDSRAPLAGVLAHLVNELLIHGRDIARATRSRWPIPPQDAALFLEVFIVGVGRYKVGHLLDSKEPAQDRRIAVELRSKYTTPVTLVLRNGQISVEEPGGDTDVRLSFDPAMLNLMLFHRVSRLRALLTGKVVVRGPRPWLLLTFLRTMRMPP